MLALPQSEEVVQLGQIQAFEFTFELAWKVLKDFLNARGVPAAFARDVLKEAFRHGLITDGDAWLDMLEKRNLMAHTYDEKRADEAAHLILTSFYPALQQLHITL